MSAPLALALSLAAAPQAAPEDLDLVVEAVAVRCFECHAADKAKGGLRLDVADGWRDVMDDEAPADSELFYRVDLPASDFDAMPPSGERMPADERAALLRFLTAPDMEALDARLTALRDATRASEALRASVAAATGARITEARAPGGERGSAGPGAPRYAVDWSLAASPPTGDEVRALAPLAPFVAELSFAGQQLDPAALPHLPALRRVHAERSRLDSAGLAALLERAPELTYLNVHSCPLGDDAAAALAAETGLRRLVLFGTDLTGGAAAELRRALPGCAITAPRAASADPFAAAEAREPRRVLVATRGAEGGGLTLFRERAIGHPEVAWTARPGVGAETVFESVAWLGEAGAPGAGHGRVAVGMRLGAGTTPATYVASVDALERGADERPPAPREIRFLSGARVTVSDDRRTALVAAAGDDGPPAVLWPRSPEAAGEPAPTIRRVQPLGGTVVLWLDRADARFPVAVEVDAEGEVLWSFTPPEGTPAITAGQVVPRQP